MILTAKENAVAVVEGREEVFEFKTSDIYSEVKELFRNNSIQRVNLLHDGDYIMLMGSYVPEGKEDDRSWTFYRNFCDKKVFTNDNLIEEVSYRIEHGADCAFTARKNTKYRSFYTREPGEFKKKLSLIKERIEENEKNGNKKKEEH